MSDLTTYLGCLFGGEPTRSNAEIRWRLRNGRGMGREFMPLTSRERLARIIEARGRTTDLYVGVAPRPEQRGTRDAIDRCHVLFVDCDTADSIAAVETYAPAPSMVVQSGSGLHAYWSLWPPATPDELERANRQLACHLGADLRATDAARILRPPGTFNFKTGKPVPVVLTELNVEIFTVADVVGDLPDPSIGSELTQPHESVAHATNPTSYLDSLLTIPPAEYVEALSGLVAGTDAKVCCPFHDDGSPSLHVYRTPEEGWYCFGCEQGGGIYQFAALMANYPLPLRGGDFVAVRDVLSQHLGICA